MLSSPSFSLEPFDVMLERISKHYAGWEIVAEYKHSFPVIKKQFLELTPSYNMQFQAHAPLSDINIASPNERIRGCAVNEVIDCIKVSGELGIKLVTFHPGHLSPLTMAHRELARKLTRESIVKIYAAAKDNGVKLALENMPKMAITICTAPEELLELIRGTEIGICFDFGHANTAGTIEKFLEHKNLFSNMHIHDNEGKWDQHLIPGSGTVDFQKHMKLLKGYKGNYVYEAMNLEDGIAGRKKLLELVAGSK